MALPRLVAWISPIAVMGLGVGVISGQDYPNKPIRLVTSDPGGANDLVSRIVAPALSNSLGQPVVVDNRRALIAAQTVAKAPPQGYTLLIAGNPLWLMPFMQNVSYDPLRDFSPIMLLARAPNVLVVHPSLPVTSVKELIALAKARPGELTYAAATTGSAAQLAAELFKAMAGVDMLGIPYKGGGAPPDMLAGRVQVMFPTSSAVAPHLKSGKLRALAVASAQPSPLAPGLPTVAASGLPGYQAEQLSAIFTTAKTPTAIIHRLNQAVVQLLQQPDMKERFFKAAIEAVGSSPEELETTVKSNMARMEKVIKDAGIRAD